MKKLILTAALALTVTSGAAHAKTVDLVCRGDNGVRVVNFSYDGWFGHSIMVFNPKTPHIIGHGPAQKHEEKDGRLDVYSNDAWMVKHNPLIDRFILTNLVFGDNYRCALQ